MFSKSFHMFFDQIPKKEVEVGGCMKVHIILKMTKKVFVLLLVNLD